jgi:hypothetical protein
LIRITVTVNEGQLRQHVESKLAVTARMLEVKEAELANSLELLQESRSKVALCTAAEAQRVADHELGQKQQDVEDELTRQKNEMASMMLQAREAELEKQRLSLEAREYDLALAHDEAMAGMQSLIDLQAAGGNSGPMSTVKSPTDQSSLLDVDSTGAITVAQAEEARLEMASLKHRLGCAYLRVEQQARTIQRQRHQMDAAQSDMLLVSRGLPAAVDTPCYRCVAAAAITAEFDGSDLVDASATQLQAGETVDALDTRATTDGRARIYTHKGWISVVASSGETLLVDESTSSRLAALEAVIGQQARQIKELQTVQSDSEAQVARYEQKLTDLRAFVAQLSSENQQLVRQHATLVDEREGEKAEVQMLMRTHALVAQTIVEAQNLQKLQSDLSAAVHVPAPSSPDRHMQDLAERYEQSEHTRAQLETEARQCSAALSESVQHRATLQNKVFELQGCLDGVIAGAQRELGRIQEAHEMAMREGIIQPQETDSATAAQNNIPMGADATHVAAEAARARRHDEAGAKTPLVSTVVAVHAQKTARKFVSSVDASAGGEQESPLSLVPAPAPVPAPPPVPAPVPVSLMLRPEPELEPPAHELRWKQQEEHTLAIVGGPMRSFAVQGTMGESLRLVICEGGLLLQPAGIGGEGELLALRFGELSGWKASERHVTIAQNSGRLLVLEILQPSLLCEALTSGAKHAAHCFDVLWDGVRVYLRVTGRALIVDTDHHLQLTDLRSLEKTSAGFSVRNKSGTRFVCETDCASRIIPIIKQRASEAAKQAKAAKLAMGSPDKHVGR